MPLNPVKLIGYAPDLPATTQGVLTAVKGIMATPRGISSMPSFTAQSSGAIDTDSIGTFAIPNVAGTNFRYYIGTAAKIWQYDGSSTLTDRSGATYTATNWSFTAFGDVTIAASITNATQKATSISGAFSALSGAPKAKIVCTVGPPSSPFVMALNYDDGTATADGWYCSGISDYTTWNSVAAQSVNGRLLEPAGPITCAIPFRDGLLAWKSYAMYRGDYVGSPVVWQWTKISNDIGCKGMGYAVAAHDVVYFADARGMWVYDGSYPRRIGGYVHDFWANLVPVVATDDTSEMKYDFTNQTLWISFVNATSNRNWLFYNITSGVWGGSVAAGSAGELTTTTGATVKRLIILGNFNLLVTGSDKKVSVGLMDASAAGSGSLIKSELRTWYEGDVESYITVNRVRPYFTNTLTGLSNAGTAPSTTAGTVCNLVIVNDSAITSPSAQSTGAIDAAGGYKFDTTSAGNAGHFIAADMVLLGQWGMSHIAMASQGAGTSA